MILCSVPLMRAAWDRAILEKKNAAAQFFCLKMQAKWSRHDSLEHDAPMRTVRGLP